MKVAALLTILLLLILFPWAVKSQDKIKNSEWLPKGNLFPTLKFDIKESQFSGGLYGFYSNGYWQNRIFAVFSAGLRRNVIRWNHRGGEASELGFEICVFPQFIFEKPFQTFRANFFNIDFKVGLQYQSEVNENWRLRGRFYHISSHLGDDYIFRYEIDHFTSNYRIFEMVDFSAAWLKYPFMAYGTLGCIVHSTYELQPFVIQLGAEWKRVSKRIPWFQWTAGIDLRGEQANAFRPCIHTGAGVILGKPDRFPFTILIDYYNGFLPFSLYDDVFIQLFGASIYFDVF